ncbi:MAG: enoyl-CoA hydratase-related protein [Myxococcota bacterium]|nr:enoyl-CoA hydratase-related protein [Myxococcota bacterium]
MSYETVLYDVSDRIATITLNRPEVLNAVSKQMQRELYEAFQSAEQDPEVWTVIVTAAGRGFCPGADVGAISESGKVSYAEPYLGSYPQWEPPREATPPFREMAKPIVCAVNGVCCGAGLDLITTSDIVIASEKASFFDPHVSIGLVSAREMARLARVLPFNICMRMALMGKHERMDAERAYQLGLVSEVVEHERLGERAREIAQTINQNAPLAVRGTRLALRKGQGLPLYEAELVAEMFRERVTKTEDALEGPRSFKEKRPPRWKAE